GVTHVVSYESPVLYMVTADTQGYRPAWAQTSRSGPGAFVVGAAPKDELVNNMGPGWQQVSDLAAGQIKKPVSAAETRCRRTLTGAGVMPGGGTPTLVGVMICAEIYHFVTAMTHATIVSPEGFRAAAESTTDYVSPLTFAVDYRGGRHDGATKYRFI